MIKKLFEKNKLFKKIESEINKLSNEYNLDYFGITNEKQNINFYIKLNKISKDTIDVLYKDKFLVGNNGKIISNEIKRKIEYIKKGINYIKTIYINIYNNFGLKENKIYSKMYLEKLDIINNFLDNIINSYENFFMKGYCKNLQEQLAYDNFIYAYDENIWTQHNDLYIFKIFKNINNLIKKNWINVLILDNITSKISIYKENLFDEIEKTIFLSGEYFKIFSEGLNVFNNNFNNKKIKIKNKKNDFRNVSLFKNNLSNIELNLLIDNNKYFGKNFYGFISSSGLFKDSIKDNNGEFVGTFLDIRKPYTNKNAFKKEKEIIQNLKKELKEESILNRSKKKLFEKLEENFITKKAIKSIEDIEVAKSFKKNINKYFILANNENILFNIYFYNGILELFNSIGIQELIKKLYIKLLNQGENIQMPYLYKKNSSFLYLDVNSSEALLQILYEYFDDNKNKKIEMQKTFLINLAKQLLKNTDAILKNINSALNKIKINRQKIGKNILELENGSIIKKEIDKSIKTYESEYFVEENEINNTSNINSNHIYLYKGNYDGNIENINGNKKKIGKIIHSFFQVSYSFYFNEVFSTGSLYNLRNLDFLDFMIKILIYDSIFGNKEVINYLKNNLKLSYTDIIKKYDGFFYFINFLFKEIISKNIDTTIIGLGENKLFKELLIDFECQIKNKYKNVKNINFLVNKETKNLILDIEFVA